MAAAMISIITIVAVSCSRRISHGLLMGRSVHLRVISEARAKAIAILISSYAGYGAEKTC
jgi:hypothetical protein